MNEAVQSIVHLEETKGKTKQIQVGSQKVLILYHQVQNSSIMFWQQNLRLISKKSIVPQSCSLAINADASMTGWGAVDSYGNQTSGLFPQKTTFLHIPTL